MRHNIGRETTYGKCRSAIACRIQRCRCGIQTEDRTLCATLCRLSRQGCVCRAYRSTRHRMGIATDSHGRRCGLDSAQSQRKKSCIRSRSHGRSLPSTLCIYGQHSSESLSGKKRNAVDHLARQALVACILQSRRDNSGATTAKQSPGSGGWPGWSHCRSGSLYRRCRSSVAHVSWADPAQYDHVWPSRSYVCLFHLRHALVR